MSLPPQIYLKFETLQTRKGAKKIHPGALYPKRVKQNTWAFCLKPPAPGLPTR